MYVKIRRHQHTRVHARTQAIPLYLIHPITSATPTIYQKRDISFQTIYSRLQGRGVYTALAWAL